MPRQNKKITPTETDSTFILKLVLYLVLATLWLKFSNPLILGGFSLHALPVGFIIGLIFASHEHFAIDRKIEYAILLVMTIVAYFLPAGILL